MKKILLLSSILFMSIGYGQAQREVISLNGEWDFEQTTNSFPPENYTKKIPVPGLIHLAVPRIEDYSKYFKGPQDVDMDNVRHDLNQLSFVPKYSWYKKTVKIGNEWKGKEVALIVKKSQYVTTVFVNGRMVGQSVECYTPIIYNLNKYLKFGEENEILISVGQRFFLPDYAFGGTDNEKAAYLPGIWDDVELVATGNLRIENALFLPNLAEKRVTAKLRIRSNYRPQLLNGEQRLDSCHVNIIIREKKSLKVVTTASHSFMVWRANYNKVVIEIPMPEAHAWSPNDPFLYEGVVVVKECHKNSDVVVEAFGMRDFKRDGEYFTLNGERIYLRGSNICLHRFFEDPACSDLAWNREWVKKMLIDLPKSLDWNIFRTSVGIFPDFWYDLCDEYGIMLQNEWLYWQNHGWADQIKHEFRNWIWTDGSHPSIIIWDAINENVEDFIGQEVIPEMRRLDPTRVYDAGYMGEGDDMDEPHYYEAFTAIPNIDMLETFSNGGYPIGNLDYWGHRQESLNQEVPLICNEYGWIWLWRDGRTTSLSNNNYNYFAGEDATPEMRREMQAYWLEMETEWLRNQRRISGVLCFCYLTNNYGYTGDWFVNDIRDLDMSPTLKWYKHCFAEQAVFINLPDNRYMKPTDAHKPGQKLEFGLIAVNDAHEEKTGHVVLKLYNSKGRVVVKKKLDVTIPAYDKVRYTMSIIIPKVAGGYTMIAEFSRDFSEKKTLSRRYLRVGDLPEYKYFEVDPEL